MADDPAPLWHFDDDEGGECGQVCGQVSSGFVSACDAASLRRCAARCCVAAPPNTLSLTADLCRVCRSEAEESKPLIYPCKCSGSVRYVHSDW